MRRILWSVAALACLAWGAALGWAQAVPKFEVASVKPAAPLDTEKIRAAITNGQTPRLGARVEGERAEYIYVALRDLISLAYGVKSNLIAGPDWISTQTYDIIAKMPAGASKDDVPKMLQALLADRFRLALHRGTKEVTALVLEVGEGGPKLRVPGTPKPIDPAAPLAPGEKQIDSPDGPMRVSSGKNGETMNMGAKGALSYSVDPANRTMKIEASQVTMGGLADMLTTFMRATGGSLEVKDMTGLAGSYAVEFSFSLEDLQGAARSKWIDDSGANAPAGPASAASDPGSGQSLLKAVQSMGLKLTQRKVTVDQLVIDRAEKTPTEN
jgi:uncharacterized protein (TIGR03435 family)